MAWKKKQVKEEIKENPTENILPEGKQEPRLRVITEFDFLNLRLDELSKNLKELDETIKRNLEE